MCKFSHTEFLRLRTAEMVDSGNDETTQYQMNVFLIHAVAVGISENETPFRQFTSCSIYFIEEIRFEPRVCAQHRGFFIRERQMSSRSEREKLVIFPCLTAAPSYTFPTMITPN